MSRKSYLSSLTIVELSLISSESDCVEPNMQGGRWRFTRHFFSFTHLTFSGTSSSLECLVVVVVVVVSCYCYSLDNGLLNMYLLFKLISGYNNYIYLFSLSELELTSVCKDRALLKHSSNNIAAHLQCQFDRFLVS